MPFCASFNEALPILRHRIIPNYNATGEGITSDDIVKKLAASL